jgi:hypothetical protein
MTTTQVIKNLFKGIFHMQHKDKHNQKNFGKYKSYQDYERSKHYKNSKMPGITTYVLIISLNVNVSIL